MKWKATLKGSSYTDLPYCWNMTQTVLASNPRASTGTISTERGAYLLRVHGRLSEENFVLRGVDFELFVESIVPQVTVAQSGQKLKNKEYEVLSGRYMSVIEFFL